MSEKFKRRIAKIVEKMMEEKTKKKILFSSLMISLSLNLELFAILMYCLEERNFLSRFELIVFSTYSLIIFLGAFEKPRKFYKKIVNWGCEENEV